MRAGKIVIKSLLIWFLLWMFPIPFLFMDLASSDPFWGIVSIWYWVVAPLWTLTLVRRIQKSPMSALRRSGVWTSMFFLPVAFWILYFFSSFISAFRGSNIGGF